MLRNHLKLCPGEYISFFNSTEPGIHAITLIYGLTSGQLTTAVLRPRPIMPANIKVSESIKHNASIIERILKQSL